MYARFVEYTFEKQLRAAGIIEQIDKIPLLPFTTGREGAVDPVRNAGGVSHDLGVTLVAGPPEIHGGGGINVRMHCSNKTQGATTS